VAWLCLLAGCSAAGPDVIPTTPATESNSAAAATSDPPATPAMSDLRLQAGDKIHVTVYGERDLTGDYQVNTGGYVALPLAGSVKAIGLTPPELETALEKQFTSLRNPKVTVEVISFRPFYVLGEVQKPGEYPYRAGLNVLSAIAIAGGATYRASTSEVYIQRAGTTNLQKFQQSPTVTVMPGDLVRVPLCAPQARHLIAGPRAWSVSIGPAQVKLYRAQKMVKDGVN
jgi:protein involved in polysaccharide export with SLBB domain